MGTAASDSQAAVSPQPPPGLSISQCLDRSEAARRSGQHQQGAADAAQALALASAAGDRAAQAQALALMSLHRLRLGDAEAAVQHGQQALRHYEASGDKLAQSLVHATLAFAYHDAALGSEAMRHANAALETARACNDARALVWARSRLALACAALGEVDRGVDHAEQALAAAQRVGGEEVFSALHALSHTRLERALWQRRHNQPAEATLAASLAAAQQALALAGTGANPHRQATAQFDLCRAQLELGQHEQALLHAQACLELTHANHYRGLALEALVQLAKLQQASGLDEQALALFSQVLDQAAGQQDPRVAVQAHEALYRAHKQRGDLALALAHLEKFHALDSAAREAQADMQARLVINRLELERARDIAERARVDAEMQRLRADELDRAAHKDTLTGLLNRRFVDAQLPRLIARAQQRNAALAAMLIDVDHFSQIAELHGQAVADRVLTDLSALLLNSTRGSDFAARVGTDEFVIIFVDTAAEGAAGFGERLRGAVSGFAWDNLAADLRLSVSAGVCQWQPGETPLQWLQRTDAALKQAKAGGGNRLVIGD